MVFSIEKEIELTNKESVERNYGLTFDFVNQLIEKPEAIDNFPVEFNLEFIEKDLPNVEQYQSSEKSSKLRKRLVKVRNTFDLF
ncbi:MAG: hypothetical protein EOM06_00420 [Sphingobacteriia bacterium]|nr:hypothetical protein [Sphingobacteriia bacterium]